MKKALLGIIVILVLGTISICLLIDNIKYERTRDKKLTSPSGKNQIILRYDNLSRPYIFKGNTLIYKYEGSGFNEEVEWQINWITENEINLYYDSENDQFDESYKIIIP